MKSKVKLLGTLAISAISFLSYVQISHSEKLDDLLLENIEALAAGESGDDSKCFGSGSIVCPLSSNFCCLHGFSANNRAESEGAAIGHRFVPLSVPRSGAG